MKIDFAAPVLDLDGKQVEDKTIGKLIVDALMAQYPDETSLSGEEKLKRFELAQVAHKANGQDVSVEDAALIKKLIGKAYGPLVVGRVYALIK